MSPPQTRRRAPGKAPSRKSSRRQATDTSEHEGTTEHLAPVLPFTIDGLAAGGQLHDGDLDDLDAWRDAGEHLADHGLTGIVPNEVFAALRNQRRPA